MTCRPAVSPLLRWLEPLAPTGRIWARVRSLLRYPCSSSRRPSWPTRRSRKVWRPAVGARCMRTGWPTSRDSIPPPCRHIGSPRSLEKCTPWAAGSRCTHRRPAVPAPPSRQRADTLEHGLGLDLGLLDRMARQGTALVPTFTVWVTFHDVARAARSARFREWFHGAYGRLGPLVSAAYEAGVTVLAGTDSYATSVLPARRRVAGEVRHLAAAGVPAAASLGAASWKRALLPRLPGPRGGRAPADLVAYNRDPRTDLRVLDIPTRIILGGRVVR